MNFDEYLDDKLMLIVQSERPVQHMCALAVPLEHKEWRAECEEDAEAIPHYQAARARKKGYKIINGLLYRQDKLYVPPSRRMALMAEAQNGIAAGHPGIRGTIANLKQY